jgi:hypothetical protein
MVPDIASRWMSCLRVSTGLAAWMVTWIMRTKGLDLLPHAINLVIKQTLDGVSITAGAGLRIPRIRSLHVYIPLGKTHRWASSLTTLLCSPQAG